MCQIIITEKPYLLDIAEHWEANATITGGIMTAYNNKLIVYKYRTANAMQAYCNFVGNKKIVLHFRYPTSGKHDYANCHPFRINEKLSFVHNGVIANWGNDSQSDTAVLCQKLKTIIKNKNYIDDALIKKLEQFGQKLVFLE